MGECLITRRGGSMKLYALAISTTAGATVTITNNRKTYTQTTDSSGNVIFNKIAEGTWCVTVTKGSLVANETVSVTDNKSVTIVLNTIPEFTYKNSSGSTAKYEIYNANGVNITDNPETQGDWKIKFLESGTLTFNRLNGADHGIDVFCVGGGGNGGNANSGSGGGGGAGGFTSTEFGINIENASYEIVVGGAAGTTSAFNVEAEGGGNGGDAWRHQWSDGTANGPYAHYVGGSGGNGGSGGGAGGWTESQNGGTDGYDGEGVAQGTNFNNNRTGYFGTGQRSVGRGSTKEFGEEDGTLYASGGSGGSGGSQGSPTSQTPNTGNGGGGGSDNGGTPGEGSSGIVVIRNKR